MKKVLIWGTGETATNMMRNLRKNIVILGFIDNYPKAGMFLSYRVYRPEELWNFDYDYILIFSKFIDEILPQMKAMKIDQTKILALDSARLAKVMVFEHFFFRERIDNFKKVKDPIQLIVTGISYLNDGIRPKYLKVPSFNFAYRSQDLFCDFEITKYLFQHYDMSSLKYLIIGLCYYSFEYDLSKSGSAWQMMRYYPYINSLHNLISDQYYDDYYNQCMIDLQSLSIPQGIIKYNLRNFDINDLEGEKTAKADYNKNYPATVFENKRILKEYIQFIEEKQIKPIFVIMPVTKYYSAYSPLSIKQKFYNNLYEVLGDRKYQILDYFDKLEYPDSYYYHVNHLNRHGAVAFTNKLNEDIQW